MLFYPVRKIAEKAVCRSVLALYFQCWIKKKRTPSDCFSFGNFAHFVDTPQNRNSQTSFYRKPSCKVASKCSNV